MGEKKLLEEEEGEEKLLEDPRIEYRDEME